MQPLSYKLDPQMVEYERDWNLALNNPRADPQSILLAVVKYSLLQKQNIDFYSEFMSVHKNEIQQHLGVQTLKKIQNLANSYINSDV